MFNEMEAVHFYINVKLNIFAKDSKARQELIKLLPLSTSKITFFSFKKRVNMR